MTTKPAKSDDRGTVDTAEVSAAEAALLLYGEAIAERERGITNRSSRPNARGLPAYIEGSACAGLLNSAVIF